MTDVGATIAPKSDQLNADDLIAGPMTVTITNVRGMSDADQPIAISFEGDQGRPYKPGKSMRRVLVQVWGRDGQAYVGQSMTLYRDPSVKFGKDEVGGIRISHMTGIDREKQIPLTVTRGQKKPHAVKPLEMRGAPTQGDARQALMDATDLAALEKAWKSKAMAPFRDELRGEMETRKAALTPADTTSTDTGAAPSNQGTDYEGV